MGIDTSTRNQVVINQIENMKDRTVTKNDLLEINAAVYSAPPLVPLLRGSQVEEVRYKVGMLIDILGALTLDENVRAELATLQQYFHTLSAYIAADNSQLRMDQLTALNESRKR